MSHPTHAEARAARKLLLREKYGPGSVPRHLLAAAEKTLRARTQWLSERHKASPKYRSKAYKAQAARITDPLAYIVKEAKHNIDLLRASIDPRAPDELAALVEYIEGF